MGRKDNILAFIIDGEPNIADKPGMAAEECFPVSLRYKADSKGNLTDERSEPTAADVRPSQDRKRVSKLRAKLKLIAGLSGITYSVLSNREKTRRRKHFITILMISLCFLIAGIFGWNYLQSEKRYQLAMEYADKGHKARSEHDWGIALINYKKSLEIADNMPAKIGASHALANFFPEIFQFSAEDPITTTCFSHDGKLLAYSYDDTVSILDTQTWVIYKKLKKSKSFGSYDPDEYINSLAFSFDDRKLVAHSGQSIIIWVLDSGIELNNNIKFNTSFSYRSTNAFSLSPIGDFLISLGSDIRIHKHSLHDGKLISEYKGNSPISSLAFSNDGQMFASGCDDGSIQLWDITDKNKSVQLLGHTSPVISMSFHPEESLLASLSSDNELILWDTTTSNIVSKYNTPDNSSNRAVRVAFLQSGRMLLACDSSIHIFDYDVAKMSREYAWRTYHSWMGMADNFTLYHPIAELKYPIGQIDSVSVSPDEQLLAVSSNEFVKLWSTQCLDNIQRNISNNNRPVNILSKDGNLIGSGDEHGTVNVRHIYPENELVVNRDHSYEITALAFSVDNQYVTSGDKDGNIRVLNIETQESKIVGKHGYQIDSLLFSPNSSFVAAISQNGVLCIWKCNTSSLKYKTTLHSHRSLKPMAFSPDERFLIISTDGKLIKIDTFLYSV